MVVMETSETSGPRVTIRDVAAAAGVSVATVSNVVNGHAHVREGTSRKVLDAIERLGYRPSRAAKSLPAGRTFLLGYCLAGGPTPNAALDSFLREIAITASGADLELLLFARQGDQSPTEPYVELLRRGGADGFVLADIGYDDPRARFLAERNIPFACFGRVEDPPGVSWVDIDGATGLRMAVEHLVDLGHERIALVGWPEGSLAGDDRIRGAVAALDAAGLEADRIVRSTNEFDRGRQLVADLLDRYDPTAVACVSDDLALGVMAGLRDAGIEPGGQVAVTGFDDTPAAMLTAPGLSSLRQPMDRVGALLVERLVAQIRGTTPPEPTLVEPELVVRASTRTDDG